MGSLTRYAASMRDPDPQQSFATCREAFHREGIVCISLAELEARCGWVAARALRTIGNQYFGERK
jgi:hypothetical protein